MVCRIVHKVMGAAPHLGATCSQPLFIENYNNNNNNVYSDFNYCSQEYLPARCPEHLSYNLVEQQMEKSHATGLSMTTNHFMEMISSPSTSRPLLDLEYICKY